jgi:colanic acid/amylovoran biosynthesis glycosyltransferase
MRIGYLIANFPVLSETFVVNDIRGLEALGHEVTAIALGEADPATDGNPNYTIKGKTIRVKGLHTPVLRKFQKLISRSHLSRKYGERFTSRFHKKPSDLPDELWQDRLAWDAALHQIDDLNLDFLHVHFAMRQLLLGYHASRLLDIPLGCTLPAHDIFTNPLTKFFPQLLGQCSFAITVSHYNKEAILKLAPNLDPSKIHVQANGIDVNLFQPRFHDPDSPFRFAAVGRLVEIKGFHILVEAAGILAKRRRDFSIDIIGDGPFRTQLEHRIHDLEIEHEVQLLGPRDHTFIANWLPDQDSLILPCVIAKDGNRDGMPMVLREAMACGLPVISTQLLGLHETVTPETGLLVRPDDPASLADGMEHVLNLSHSSYRAMAQAARQRAQDLFSLQHQVGLLTQWIEQSVGARHASASSVSTDNAQSWHGAGSLIGAKT